MEKATYLMYQSALETSYKHLEFVFDPIADYDESEEELQDLIQEALFSVEIALNTLRDLKPEEEDK